MKNKILLDCTFRDGGYYNKWNFDLNLFSDYIECMSICKIDIVEIGFRFNAKKKYLGNFAYTTDSFLQKLDLPKNIKYAVMINAKEFYKSEGDINKIFSLKKKSIISIVRIAINFNEYRNSKKIINNLNNLGYDVGLNLMQAHDKNELDIIEMIKEIKSWSVKIDYLYFADSLGCMDNNYIEHITNILVNNWQGTIGIHAHNNKSMALSNTLISLNNGANICDSTILGMGRGAGNAQTEFLLQEIKSPITNKQLKLINSLILKFQKLRLKFNWGYNFLYFYAANNKIHPTYIQTFLSEQRYSEVQILNILSQISAKDLLSYSKSKIENIFYENIKTANSQSNLKINIKDNKKAIIVGNGNSILNDIKKIKHILSKQNFTSFFLNKNNFINNHKYADYTVVVNTIRLMSDLNQYSKKQINLIAPVNKFKKLFQIKFKNKKIYNYSVCIKPKTFITKNNYTVIPYDLAINYALSICKIFNFKEVYFIGIDGYDDIEKNEELNESINLFKKSFKNIKLFSLTQSKIDNKFIKKSNYF